MRVDQVCQGRAGPVAMLKEPLDDLLRKECDMRPIEPRELRQRYRQLDDEALLALRARGADMTDDAHNAIAGELAARGLAVPPIPDQPSRQHAVPSTADIGCWLLAAVAAAVGVIGFIRTDNPQFPAAALLVVAVIRLILYRRRRQPADSDPNPERVPR